MRETSAGSDQRRQCKWGLLRVRGRRCQAVEPQGKVGNEIGWVFQSSVNTQRRPFRLPSFGSPFDTFGCWDDQAFETAPTVAQAEEGQSIEERGDRRF